MCKTPLQKQPHYRRGCNFTFITHATRLRLSRGNIRWKAEQPQPQPPFTLVVCAHSGHRAFQRVFPRLKRRRLARVMAAKLRALKTLLTFKASHFLGVLMVLRRVRTSVAVLQNSAPNIINFSAKERSGNQKSKYTH